MQQSLVTATAYRKLAVACALSLALTGCGGGSGTENPTATNPIGDTTDSDNDGLTDTRESELGTNPSLADTDGDGLDDGPEVDIFATDPLSADTDGDGINDLLDENPNQFDSNTDGGTGVGDPNGGGTAPCGLDGDGNAVLGTDTNSSTTTWRDNCEIGLFGPVATSQYTRGVQRIVFCRGHGQGEANVLTFSDGRFGNNSEQAVRDFQREQSITIDGVVGPETWDELQAVLAEGETTGVGNELSFGIAESALSCLGDIQFYLSAPGGSWTMARSPNSDQRVPFSTANPDSFAP